MGRRSGGGGETRSSWSSLDDGTSRRGPLRDAHPAASPWGSLVRPPTKSAAPPRNPFVQYGTAQLEHGAPVALQSQYIVHRYCMYPECAPRPLFYGQRLKGTCTRQRSCARRHSSLLASGCVGRGSPGRHGRTHVRRVGGCAGSVTAEAAQRPKKYEPQVLPDLPLLTRAERSGPVS